jgi:hypothetical protein
MEKWLGSQKLRVIEKENLIEFKAEIYASSMNSNHYSHPPANDTPRDSDTPNHISARLQHQVRIFL